MKKLILICCLIAGTAIAAEPIWRQNYSKGLQFMAQGKYEDGIAYLKMAAADKPISEIVQDGNGPLEYLPYLQLGIAYHHLGRIELATEFFELEKSLTALSKSKAGQQLIAEYQSKAAKSSKAQSNQNAEEIIRDFKKKPYLLPENEVTRMKEEIRQRCNLPKADERSYPWYYHYELGLAMKHKNDWQRALDSFINALDYRDRPQKMSRIYGMWFIEYYPYYNIGLAHYNLRNWKCANDSFQLSQMLEDVPRNSSDYKSLLQMKEEVERHLNESK
jgi:tetratricopeptide (TPR) repeat protein